MSTERDELAEDIRSLGITVVSGPPVDLSAPLAQHLGNLGYRKPRTITTVEELDAMPNGSSVLCLDAAGEGHPAQKSADGWGLPFSSSLWSAQHLLEGCESITVIQEWAA